MWGREVRGRAARAWPSEGRRPAAAKAVGEAEAEPRQSRVGRVETNRFFLTATRDRGARLQNSKRAGHD
jgi:hypothetical protein